MNHTQPNPAPPVPPAPPASSAAAAAPASAAAAAAADAKQKNAPARPRKRGGFMRRLFVLLLLVAAGAAAYVYYHPEMLAQVAPGLAPKPAKPDTADTADAAVRTEAKKAEPAPKPAAPKPARDPRVDEVTSEVSSLRRQMAQMESRLNQVDAAARAGRAADSANTRLLLAAMLLQSDGNTQSAAAALRRVADGESLPPEMAKLVRAEALRLEQAPDRARILNQIAELRRLLRKFKGGANQDGAAGPDGAFSFGRAGAFLRDAFNVSRRDSGDAAKALREAVLTDLARMEFFLFAGNRAEYRLSLDAALRGWGEMKTPDADPNIELKFSLLRQFGAPDYRLNLPLDKP